MTNRPTPTRRQCLIATGTIGTTALSGCLSDDSEDQTFTADDVDVTTGDGIAAAITELDQARGKTVNLKATIQVADPGDYYLRADVITQDDSSISTNDDIRRLVPGQTEEYWAPLSYGTSFFGLFSIGEAEVDRFTFHAYSESEIDDYNQISEEDLS